MLNDKIRNTAYCLAIRKCINSTYNEIVDIGTGSGILSVFAAQAPGVKRITAIEESKTLYKIAKSVFNANHVNATLINKYSTDLQLQEVKGNLLIAEIFDAALFGEHILETLIHAWNFILNKENTKVIPESANVYITGIHCLELWKTHKLVETISELNLDTECITKIFKEPYDAENLREKNVQYLTDAPAIAQVDFSSCYQLEQMYFRKDFFQPVTLQCKESGILHAFAVWFDLHLDQEIAITSNPLIDSVKCWDQAIFYLDHPIEMKEGETLQLEISIPSERFSVKVTGRDDVCAKCIKISKRIIRFLNDKKLVDQIITLVDSLTVDENTSVLDLNVFPLFGFLMAKRGAKVYCVADATADRNFINHQSVLNDFEDHFHVLRNEELDNVLESMDSLNYLFLIPINPDGLVSEHYLNDLAIFSRNLDGEILPNSIKVLFELIESEHLDTINKVDDDNILGFRIAEFFEEYVASEQPMLNNFPHLKLSSVVETINIMRNSNEPVSSIMDVPIIRNGCGNAILYWFDIQFHPDIKYDTSESSYCSRACFLLPEEKLVTIGDVIRIQFKMHRGFISLSIYNE